MNTVERAKMVKAMELIVRSVNNEDFMEYWLNSGVADGDLTPLSEDWDSEYDLGHYIQDDKFADLMDLFLYVMNRAYKDGGLYCDGIVSKNMEV